MAVSSLASISRLLDPGVSSGEYPHCGYEASFMLSGRLSFSKKYFLLSISYNSEASEQEVSRLEPKDAHLSGNLNEKLDNTTPPKGKAFD